MDVDDPIAVDKNMELQSDVDLYPLWMDWVDVHGRYSIVFQANGGGFEGGVDTVDFVEQGYGTEIVPPIPAREGYTLVGWNPPISNKVVVRYDTIYSAQWELNTYRMTFNTNGGVGDMVLKLEFGRPLLPPTPTKTGSTFIGWEPEVPPTVPAKDMEFMAKWNQISYSIIYDMNGHGVVPVDAKTSYVSEDETYAPPQPENPVGYSFIGWEPSSIPSGSTGNVKFVA